MISFTQHIREKLLNKGGVQLTDHKVKGGMYVYRYLPSAGHICLYASTLFERLALESMVYYLHAPVWQENIIIHHDKCVQQVFFNIQHWQLTSKLLFCLNYFVGQYNSVRIKNTSTHQFSNTNLICYVEFLDEYLQFQSSL